MVYGPILPPNIPGPAINSLGQAGFYNEQPENPNYLKLASQGAGILMQLPMQAAQRRQAKKKKKAIKKEQEYQLNQDLQDISRREGQFLADFDRASKSQLADVGYHQGTQSSYFNQVKNDQEEQKKRHLYALNRERAERLHGVAFRRKMEKLDADQEKLMNLYRNIELGVQAAQVFAGGLGGFPKA